MTYWMIRLLIQVLVHKGVISELDQKGIYAQAKIHARKDQAQIEAAAMKDDSKW